MGNKRITQRQLELLFDNPEYLYRVLAERPGYTPALPVVDGDSELVCPNVISQGCNLFICMRHQEKRAYVMLLDAAALGTLRASIEDALRSINLQSLSAPLGRPFPGF